MRISLVVYGATMSVRNAVSPLTLTAFASTTVVVVMDGAFAVAAFAIAIAGAEAMTTVANIALPIVRNIMLLSRFSSSST